jgi:hypothetical protein
MNNVTYQAAFSENTGDVHEFFDDLYTEAEFGRDLSNLQEQVQQEVVVMDYTPAIQGENFDD